MNAPITLRTRVFHLALIAVAGLGIAAPASAQTLKVLTAGAFKQVVVALVPALEAKTGMKIEIDNDTAGALVRKVQAGEPFDVLVLPPNGLATLGKEGLVDAGNIQPVARVGIGVAVKAGSPRPALAVLRGNLAPEGAVVKPSAASPELLRHRGRGGQSSENKRGKCVSHDPNLMRTREANTVRT